MIDPSLTFGSFSVSFSNRLAAEAAHRVAELPGACYNPLVLVGAEGSGKTHLLHAIANEVSTLRPTEHVALLSAEALPASSGIASMLLIDDLQNADSAEKQWAVASACERAIGSGQQVVLTARLPLRGELPGDIERLVGAGLLVELEPTDPALASSLAQRFAAAFGLRISSEALDELVARHLSAAQLQQVVEELNHHGGAREIALVELLRVLNRRVQPPLQDEFGSFLEDVSRVVAVAVESVPWRKKLGEAIEKWESEGIRTDQLEQLLQADLPTDVDVTLAEFESRASRLLQIRADLGSDAASYALDDPSRVPQAEALLASWKARAEMSPPQIASAPELLPVDAWFLNPDRVVLSAFDPTGRIPGDRR